MDNVIDEITMYIVHTQALYYEINILSKFYPDKISSRLFFQFLKYNKVRVGGGGRG